MAKNSTKTTRNPQSPIVVGVGASAGGMEAVQELLKGLGDSPGIAVVFIQHLDPHSKSLLPELIQNSTKMKVVEIKSRRTLKPNHLYISPPQKLLGLKSGAVYIANPDDERQPGTIDHFFKAIADYFGDRGIGVILSGGGSDGTLGLKAISDAGGFTLAQDAESATFDSMPRSAASNGVADYVRSPREIATELLKYASHLEALEIKTTPKQLRNSIEEMIPTIAERLMKATNHNFQHYKINTLVRRIQRRMQVLKLTVVEDYVDHLHRDEEEVQTLFRELLIGVTAFLRDPDAFEQLKEKVLPKLFEGRGSSSAVRIWSAGCANGSEAYTLAMLCREAMDELDEPCEVQIFATDIDERALQIARTGVYPIGIAEEIPPEWLQRFFVKRGKHYHVTKEIRELVLFSSHNLISDPPFSRQDLIVCRNLLIYLGSHLQNKLIPLFHFALRPGGYLFLGPSENISSHGELFHTIDSRNRISRRKGTAIPNAPSINVRQNQQSSILEGPASAEEITDLTALAQRVVLDEFAPKYVVIDETGQIRNSSADVEKYIRIGSGDYHNNIIRMAVDGLRIGLRAAIAEAKETRRRVDHGNLSIRVGDQIQRVMLTVQPMPRMGSDEPLHLVVFNDVGLPVDRDHLDAPAHEDFHPDSESVVAQMEQELEQTRLDLDRTMQDMEAANEELKSSNEELLSMNEELQSANEELETSKEEIRASSDAVVRAKDDLENLLRSSRIATVFLDEKLRIRSFTPAISEIYELIPSDMGRPLEKFVPAIIDMPTLPDPKSLKEGDLVEHTVTAHSGKSYIRRVLPYLSHTGQTDGIVVTFSDVSALRESETKLKLALSASNQVAWEWNIISDKIVWTEQLLDTFGYDSETIDSSLAGFINIIHPDDREHVEKVIEKSLAGISELYEVEFRVVHGQDGRSIWTHGKGLIERDNNGRPLRIVGVAIDASEQRKRQLELADREADLRRVIDHMLNLVGILDKDGILIDANETALKVADLSRDDVIGKPFWECHWWSWDKDVANQLRQTIERARNGETVRYDVPVRTTGDSTIMVDFMLAPIFDEHGEVTHFIPSGVDISDRKEKEKLLADAAARLDLALKVGRAAVWDWDVDANQPTVSEGLKALFGFEPTEKPLLDEFVARMDDEDRDRVAAAIQKVIREGGRYNEEYRVHRPDGEVLWLSAHGVANLDSEGKLEDFFGIVSDSTERKMREIELIKSENELRRVIDNQLPLVSLINTEGIITEINAKAVEASGLPRNYYIGKKFWETKNWQYNEAISNQIREDVELALTGEIVRYDTETELDGKICPIDFMLSPVINEDGGVDYVIASGIDISDRKAAEVQLRKSDELVRTMAENSTHALVMMDDKGYVISCNQIWIEMTGYSEEELRSAPLHYLVHHHHPDGRPYPMEECPIDRALPEDNSVRAHEDLFFRKDGSTFPVLCAASPIFENGKPVSTVIEVQDITLRKRWETELVSREAHLRKVINNQLGLVALINNDGKLLEVDDDSLRIAGLIREDVIGRNFADCAWWTYDESVTKKIADTMEQAFAGETVRFDVQLFGAGLGGPDDRLWIDFMMSPVFADDGEIEYLIASGVDISDRKRHEVELRESQERLRLGIGIAQSGLAHIDYTTGTVLLSPEAARIYGQGEEAMEISRSEFHEMIHPADQKAVQSKVEEYLEAGVDDIMAIEHRILLENGEQRWLDVRKQFLFDHDQDPPVPNHSTIAVRDITDRIHFQAELHENARRLSMALKAGGLAAWEWTPQHSFWTPELFALLGLSAELEPSTELFFKNVHPDDAAELRDAWNRTTSGGSSYDQRFRIIRPDGDIRWIRGMGEVTRDKFDKVEKIYGVNWDETEERLALAELAENRRQLALAMKSAKMGAFVWDIETDKAVWDEDWCDVLGLPHHTESTGEIFFSLVHPDDREQLEKIVEKSRAGEIEYSDEFRITSPDGKTRWLAAAGNWIQRDDGPPTLLTGLNWDITEQKENENAIRLNEERLRIAAGAAGFGTFQIDLDLKTVHWSDEMKELLGIPKEENPSPEIGVVPDFVHPDDREQLNEWMETILTDLDNPDHRNDHRIIRPDGEIRHVRMQSRTIYQGEGDQRRPHLIIGTLLDTSQQREYEAILEKDRSLAEAASIAKTEFVANMSHEIRTPMTAVLGYTDLLLDLEVNPEKKNHLLTIKRNGRFLLEIINDILDLSKIEAGKMEISSDRFAPQAIVADVRSMMYVRAGEKDLSFNVHYDGPIPAEIESDSKRLKQILVNLIGNAIKFTHSGRIDLTVRYITDGEPRLQFEVSDTGIGMTKKQQKKLFKPFTQGDTSVTREFGGSGLGLAISHRLTTMLGGKISVTSQLGKGSTFTFTIDPGPVDSHSLIDPDTCVDLEPKLEKVEKLPKLSCRVLIVDDSPDIRELAGEILRSAGATVEEAVDGQDALDRIQHTRGNGASLPDAILLDMQMPNLDGYKAAERLRETGYNAPIIAVTADAMHGDMDRCLQSGCDSYLSKPIDRKALLETLKTHLNKRATTATTDNPAVLIIEDSEDAAKGLQKLLKLRGISAIVAHTGGEGITRAEEFLPKLVILDLTLPDTNGFEVLDQLKKMADMHETTFIALTGRTDTKDVQACHDAGFHHHMGKPINFKKLLKLITDSL
ncbi:MAG: PAS domain S-box protein [Verrucomicrobiales bacterium]|nr:PAS domain S-box protein [Verrucomicrobiales bacterium]